MPESALFAEHLQEAADNGQGFEAEPRIGQKPCRIGVSAVRSRHTPAPRWKPRRIRLLPELRGPQRSPQKVACAARQADRAKARPLPSRPRYSRPPARAFPNIPEIALHICSQRAGRSEASEGRAGRAYVPREFSRWPPRKG